MAITKCRSHLPPPHPTPPSTASRPDLRYFAQSLELKKTNNARALHGLAACCHANTTFKDRNVRADVTAALHEYASEELAKLYSEQSPTLLPKVEAILETQRAAIEK